MTILAPTDGVTFRAGDVINFSGSATDVEDGTLPASAYTWNIDFLHDTHVHPGTPITGVTSGTFTIPTSGHDFNDFTRYRVSLTVTDSSGLQSTSSVIIFPQKVNLTFNAAPSGATIFLDGIAHTTPFVYDDAHRFQPHHSSAQPDDRQQRIQLRLMVGRWSSDSHHRRARNGPKLHRQPDGCDRVDSAGFCAGEGGHAADQSVVGGGDLQRGATAGNTNIVAIGWNNATSNITSVTDSAGNTYQVAVPTARGSGVSQAIYYASNIKAAAAAPTPSRPPSTPPPPTWMSGLWSTAGWPPVSPFDMGASASGTGTAGQQRHRHHHRGQ